MNAHWKISEAAIRDYVTIRGKSARGTEINRARERINATQVHVFGATQRSSESDDH